MPVVVVCPHCQQNLLIDTVLAERFSSLVQQVISTHTDEILAAMGKRGRAPRESGLHARIEELSRELQAAHHDRQQAEARTREVENRLRDLVVERTAARTDVGTELHTAHRELANQVYGLRAELNAMSRVWVDLDRPDQPREDLSLSRAAAAARIFRVLVTSDLTSEEDHQRWRSVVDRELSRATELADDAAGIVRSIAAAPGYQRWIWDIAGPGDRFDPSRHQPWQNSVQEGEIAVVVIPAYFADGVLITKPSVYVA